MFDYSLDFKHIDFREQPDLYRIGKGEQGVLLVEPYKSELLPHWRFKTIEQARTSAEELEQAFLAYKEQQDFVGMDMARKFLQMGYTRARRYANHASGQKYQHNPQKLATPEAQKEARQQQRPQELDWQSNEKAQAARIFYEVYQRAKSDPTYIALYKQHRATYERTTEKPSRPSKR